LRRPRHLRALLEEALEVTELKQRLPVRETSKSVRTNVDCGLVHSISFSRKEPSMAKKGKGKGKDKDKDKKKKKKK
jgi:hypothetical protein